MKGIVAIFRTEADFYVVASAPVPFKDFSHPMTEVALDLEDEASDPTVRIARLISENLLRKRVDTAARFPRANRPKDGNAGEQASIGDSEPERTLCRAGRFTFVDLTK